MKRETWHPIAKIRTEWNTQCAVFAWETPSGVHLSSHASCVWSRKQTDGQPQLRMGANAIKLYGMCDGVLDKSNLCGKPAPGCLTKPVSVADVLAFLDFCYDHRVFVLLASRPGPGDVDAYAHIASTYGGHPAVAGALIFAETLDLPHFDEVGKALHDGFSKVLGKDPAKTSVEQAGRIIGTAAQMQIPTEKFQSKYGQWVNVWGFDPYDRWHYAKDFLPKVPYKPYMLTENGILGANNAGCRTDCAAPCPSCDMQASAHPGAVGERPGGPNMRHDAWMAAAGASGVVRL